MSDRYEILVIGSGEAGKYLALTMANAGRRTALVERKLIGESCPNVACMPSKNMIHSAKVASYLRRGVEFGAEGTNTGTHMPGVYKRKQAMVDEIFSINSSDLQLAGLSSSWGRRSFAANATWK